jgi:hypothetical protein
MPCSAQRLPTGFLVSLRVIDCSTGIALQEEVYEIEMLYRNYVEDIQDTILYFETTI